ncbi:nucleotidyltransferase domain-containing protein [Flexivirga caeni]|uniref:nucleotidyltransferase domain-containing protein n=1 Tax=Flexivirga caeni TaxID=2294115 RepID=UPI003CCC5BD2
MTQVDLRRSVLCASLADCWRRRAGPRGGLKCWSLHPVSRGWRHVVETDCFPVRFDVRSVPCLSLEQQELFHRGYEPRAKDEHDLRLLATLRQQPLAGARSAPVLISPTLFENFSYRTLVLSGCVQVNCRYSETP